MFSLDFHNNNMVIPIAAGDMKDRPVILVYMFERLFGNKTPKNGTLAIEKNR